MSQNTRDDGQLSRNVDVVSVAAGGEKSSGGNGRGKSAKVMRIVVTAGGTAGHINPALVMADEFRKLRQTVLFVGGAAGPEAQKARDAGLEFLGVKVKGLYRTGIVNQLKAAAMFPLAVSIALRSVSVFRPDAVVGFGGYASGPAALASVIRSVPLFLQEQNVYPGLVTRMLKKRARRVYSSFSESGRWLKGADVLCAGNPTRPGFYNPGRRFENKTRLTLLVMGGSQGARSINRAVIEGLLLIRDFGLKIFHQCGVNDFEDVKSAYARFMPDAVVAPFFDNMAEIMATADIAIARAGASSCAELALSGLPALLIPYPGAGGHQLLNAKALVDNGAARMIDDSEMTGSLLAQKLGELVKDKNQLEKMSANCREMARPDAAKVIVNDIRKLMGAQWA
jgi:UDP-N-acetylglucosamine--N-acetylmuramyl-(pentapeptide) pyrophosphoryl-undecaprenol N-acetylglucosamine transferase